ncbi:MAG TPA: hypothetical protein VGR35_09030 [Tepidisphaeraceae bacterium]|nr:hypothetical protein [Tepidisphaeraceae bacterium]
MGIMLPPSPPPRVFVLSPASCAGERARILLRDEAQFDLAVRLRTEGATIGETFSFLSGLYFRGKLAYASAFARPPRAGEGVLVITTHRGLLPPATRVNVNELRDMACVPIEMDEPRYRGPMERDAEQLACAVGDQGEVVLLGSIATPKYVDILRAFLGPRLRFPAEFVGRGDMSRGGLMLRQVQANQELAYLPLDGATRRGKRPPKLEPILKAASRAANRNAQTKWK